MTDLEMYLEYDKEITRLRNTIKQLKDDIDLRDEIIENLVQMNLKKVGVH